MSLTVYRQEWTRKEGRIGTLSFRLSFADVYDNLFLSSGIDEKFVDFIKLGTHKQDLQDDEGRMVEDELDIEISRVLCKTDDEVDCFDFLKAASDDTVKRYMLL